jgi:hypothetical protein
MTSTKPIYGTVLNKNDVQDKITGPVKASVTLAIGLVYQDGANGWTNAPTDGSVYGRQLYWNEKVLTATSTLGEIVGTFYGEGARVVGKSDGIITAHAWCKASTNFANGFIINSDPVDATVGATFGAGTKTETAVNNVRNWQRAKIAIYHGHVLEVIGNTTVPSSSADLETDCVFEITRG